MIGISEELRNILEAPTEWLSILLQGKERELI